MFRHCSALALVGRLVCGLSLALASLGQAQEELRLEYQSAPLRSVLKSLADYAELGLIAGDKVDGEVTMQFSAADWRAALQHIGWAFELNLRINDGILYAFKRADVSPSPKPEADTEADAEPELQIRRFPLDYADSQELADLLMQAKQADVSASRAALARGIWSERLFIAPDERSNSLYVQGYEDELSQLEQIIPELDSEPLQVSFSVSIVIAEFSVAREFGVRFGGQALGGNFGVAGGDSGAFAASGFSDSLFVDFGLSSSAAPRLALGFSDANNLLNLELSALDSEDKVDIVSQPMVTTRDGGTALISTGTEVPYIVSGEDDDSVEFRSAVLSLEVSPRVSHDGEIIHLRIEVTQDAIGAEINDQPSIDTNRLQAEVSVRSGQMSMLGGIKQSRQVSVRREVPWWGRLPLIGWLFGYESSIAEEGELLIFITPEILASAK